MGKKLSKATSKTKEKYVDVQREEAEDDEEDEEVATVRGPLSRTKQTSGQMIDKIIEKRSQASKAVEESQSQPSKDEIARGKIKKQPNVPEEDEPAPS